MARFNNCNATAADIALFCGSGSSGGGAEEYYWDVTEQTQKDFVIEHGFGAKFLRCNVYDVDGGYEVFPAITYEGVGRLTVRFAEAPGNGKRFKIVITYHGETGEED